MGANYTGSRELSKVTAINRVFLNQTVSLGVYHVRSTFMQLLKMKCKIICYTVNFEALIVLHSHLSRCSPMPLSCQMAMYLYKLLFRIIYLFGVLTQFVQV